jgi:hypothetical protein
MGKTGSRGDVDDWWRMACWERRSIGAGERQTRLSILFVGPDGAERQPNSASTLTPSSGVELVCSGSVKPGASRAAGSRRMGHA